MSLLQTKGKKYKGDIFKMSFVFYTYIANETNEKGT